MLLKERKLLAIIYILRYGIMTDEQFRMLGTSTSRTKREADMRKLLEIPGIYSNNYTSEFYSFYYLVSHRVPIFYGANGKKILLKDIKTKSPPELKVRLELTTIESMREYFV